MSKRMLIVIGDGDTGAGNGFFATLRTYYTGGVASHIHWSCYSTDPDSWLVGDTPCVDPDSPDSLFQNGEYDFLRFKRSQGIEVDVIALSYSYWTGHEDPDFRENTYKNLTCEYTLEPLDEDDNPNFKSCEWWCINESCETNDDSSFANEQFGPNSLYVKLWQYYTEYPDLEYVIFIGGSQWESDSGQKHVVPNYKISTYSDISIQAQGGQLLRDEIRDANMVDATDRPYSFPPEQMISDCYGSGCDEFTPSECWTAFQESTYMKPFTGLNECQPAWKLTAGGWGPNNFLKAQYAGIPISYYTDPPFTVGRWPHDSYNMLDVLSSIRSMATKTINHYTFNRKTGKTNAYSNDDVDLSSFDKAWMGCGTQAGSLLRSGGESVGASGVDSYWVEQAIPRGGEDGDLLRSSVSNVFTGVNNARKFYEYADYTDFSNGEYWERYLHWKAGGSWGDYDCPNCGDNIAIHPGNLGGTGGSVSCHSFKDRELMFYRGWGGANSWKDPEWWHYDIRACLNSENHPIIFTMVCDSGDWAPVNEDGQVSPGIGSRIVSAWASCSSSTWGQMPCGAVAVIGPTDLDTDTAYNNPFQDAIVDALTKDKITEISKHIPEAIKRESEIYDMASVLNENEGDSGAITPMAFYGAVYHIIGDPSLDVHLGQPSKLFVDVTDELYENGGKYNNPIQLYDKQIYVNVTDNAGNPVEGVLGALLLDENYLFEEDPHMSELLTTEESDENGNIEIDFTGMSPTGLRVTLWLNKSQFIRRPITFIYLGPIEGEEEE